MIKEVVQMMQNKAQKFIGAVAKWIILLFFAGIIFALLVAAFLTTCTVPEKSEVIMYDWDFSVIHIAVAVALTALGVFLKNKNISFFSDRKVALLSLFFVVGFYLIYILSTQLSLISDQKFCFEASTQFLNGNYEAWKPDGYAGRYPNQNGLILFFSLVQLVFGKGNYLVIQFINLIAAVLSAFYLAKTGEIALNLKNKANTTLLLMLYAPMILYITFTYGTMIGLCLSVIGIYYQIKFLKYGKWPYALISGICIPTAMIFKSNYLIVLVASVLVYIFYAIYKKRVRNIVAVIAIICVYAFTNFGVTAIIEKKTDTEISKGVPTVAWITMGISESVKGPGWWSGYNNKMYVDAGCDTEKAHLQGVEDLKERIEYMKGDLTYTAKFFSKKLLSMWSEPSFQSLWIQFVKEHPFEFPEWVSSLFSPDGTINSLYYRIYDIIQTLVYFFTLVYLIMNTKKIKIYQLLPGIIMIGGFLFHLIWEAKGQYSVVYFFLIIPYAISGFIEFTEIIHRKLLNKLPDKM